MQINTKPKSLQTIAQKAFTWMLYSLDFSRVDGMRFAVTIDETCKTLEDLETKLYDEETIIEACAGFLTMENDEFRFIHHSV